MTGHLSEEELIGYQLGESVEPASAARHLEQCELCSAAAASIAETLRVFSADPVPEANLDRAWQRLRGSLPLLYASRPAVRWRLPLVWTSIAAMAALLLGFALHRVPHGTGAGAGAGAIPNSAQTEDMRAGPLTRQPRDEQVAMHLGDAERLLTEIDHTAGPLDEGTRERAAQLLVSNTMYVQRAERDGDLAQASVLEELGRTLTTVEHEPAKPPKSWNIRMEMNASGLLLDIRILQQNDAEPTRKESQ